MSSSLLMMNSQRGGGKFAQGAAPPPLAPVLDITNETTRTFWVSVINYTGSLSGHALRSNNGLCAQCASLCRAKVIVCFVKIVCFGDRTR